MYTYVIYHPINTSHVYVTLFTDVIDTLLKPFCSFIIIGILCSLYICERLSM